MSSIISALDNFTPSQIGENGSIEYTWSNNFREKIVQLSFQLTRTRDVSLHNFIYTKTDSILTEIKAMYKIGTLSRDEYLEYMSIMFRMVGQTRDIIEGKGEYALSYVLLGVWHKHFPELAKFALRHFVLSPEGSPDFHPYGSWKDIKYLYDKYEYSSLIEYGVDLLLEQINKDSTSENPSLVSKWIPREHSKFGGLFNELALLYYKDYLVTAKSDEAKKRAIRKAKTNFRKLISHLNKQIDTVQIKQCGRAWAFIDPAKQTSITMHKQKSAFLNKDKNGEQRTDNEDRITCANNFKEFANKAKEGKVNVKGKRIGLNDFTKEALHLIKSGQKETSEADILNAQWLDNSNQTGTLGKMIAMVDVSGSMDGDPMNAAIALGIRVAEKSILGKRVMTFSSVPSWVNLDGHDNFVDMVEILSDAPWGMNTNFYLALKMILDAIVEKKLDSEDVEDMVLVIFSDMQMDAAQIPEQKKQEKSLMETIDAAYAETGRRICGKPFKSPHILFWNLRSTNGFPTISSEQNCSMMSGFSPALLNIFCDEGLSGLQSCTPWKMFVKSVNNDRYDILDTYLRNYL